MGYCTPDQYETLNRSVRGVPVPIWIPRVTTEPPSTEQLRIILRTLELVPEPHLRLLSPPGRRRAPHRPGQPGSRFRCIRGSTC